MADEWEGEEREREIGRKERRGRELEHRFQRNTPIH